MTTAIDVREIRLAHPTVVAIGKFDGMHVGHQALLQAAVDRKNDLNRRGESRGVQVAAITFDPLPSQFFNPEGELRWLSTPQERMALARHWGADIGLVQRFDTSLAQLSAAEFVDVLVSNLNMTAMVVGEDFALGRNREGTHEVLRRLGERIGFDVSRVDVVRREGYVVRSHTIRELLFRGDVQRVTSHLGHSHFVMGEVIQGVQLARRLGFPTANLAVDERRCLPLGGVYASRAWLGRSAMVHDSVTNLGYRPTFGGMELRLETHLIDFPHPGEDENLYGQLMGVSFEERLRDERKFESVEILCRQVEADIEAARQALANIPVNGDMVQFMRRLLDKDDPAGMRSD